MDRRAIADVPGTPHALALEDVLLSLGVEAREGLGEAEASARLAAGGPNQLAEAPPVPPWRRLAAQFNEIVIWILVAAALISGAVGEWTDAFAILAIVVLNGIMGFVQEEKASRAISALRKLSAPTARVVRDGASRTVPAAEIVPGDRLELEAGDKVPADARLIEAFGLRVEEAALTGESVPVEKDPGRVLAADTPLGDRRNMVYMGTVVSAGKASAAVTATGMRTELGKIAGLLGDEKQEATPLQRRLAELGKVLVVICLALVAVIFVLSLLRGGKLLDVFLSSVSLAVAAVPEGLPAVVTIGLALGLQRMVRRNALVRKLASVETLGSVTVICSDKTGTLTRNEMTVRVLFAGDRWYTVGGAGYAPRGELRRAPGPSGQAGEPVDAAREVDLSQALLVAARCNNSTLSAAGADETSWQVIGDPTEGALLVAAMKAGVTRGEGGKLLFEIPFDSERKAMSVVVREPSGRVRMYTKGAPEVIVERCAAESRGGEPVPLAPERRKQILEANGLMASRALRVLALAWKDLAEGSPLEAREEDLVFAGLAGMMDPPREEAREAVERCREAGIRPVMITGDHPATALAVARELGIAGEDGLAVTGADLERMSDDELAREVEGIPVYARVSAEDKLRVVRAWRSRNHIVAMTGDGVNDAPAVKAADIGIAMGLTGTDVTREASDMVLTDDNFASIVNAVEEGRGIYDNIQKILLYLLSCNLGEILLMLVSSLLGWPAPLAPVQLLWINLVTDGLPALALSLERPEKDLMRRKPRSPNESILSREIGLAVLAQGLLVGATAILAFGIVHGAYPEEVGRARTTAFCVLAYSELLRAFAARSRRYTLGQMGPFTNPSLCGAVILSVLLQLSVTTMPFAKPVFEAVPHFGWEWVVIVLLSFTPVTVIEVWKLVRDRLH
jgi:Ca2+-transporting ATPase